MPTIAGRELAGAKAAHALELKRQALIARTRDAPDARNVVATFILNGSSADVVEYLYTQDAMDIRQYKIIQGTNLYETKDLVGVVEGKLMFPDNSITYEGLTLKQIMRWRAISLYDIDLKDSGLQVTAPFTIKFFQYDPKTQKQIRQKNYITATLYYIYDHRAADQAAYLVITDDKKVNTMRVNSTDEYNKIVGDSLRFSYTIAYDARGNVIKLRSYGLTVKDKSMSDKVLAAFDRNLNDDGLEDDLGAEAVLHIDEKLLLILRAAAAGKSSSGGGLNVPDIKRYLSEIFGLSATPDKREDLERLLKEELIKRGW